MPLSRRRFLKTTLLAATAPVFPVRATARTSECWLEVLIPFIVHDPGSGFGSEIVLPSSTFPGRLGYRSRSDFTEYEIHGYTGSGEALPARRLEIAPMHTTVVSLSDLYGGKAFCGGARVRMRSHVNELPHFSDLFSAAYVRWNLGQGFSHVHAYPDPPHLQRGSYLSVLTLPRTPGAPFLSVFNPSGEENEALVEVYDAGGTRRHRASRPLRPFATALFDLHGGTFMEDAVPFGKDAGEGAAVGEGTVVVGNPADKPRLFFFFLAGDGKARLACEHPVLQGGFETEPSSESPFSADGQFRARQLVFSPLFFKEYATRGLTLDSRAYIGAGRPVEDPQWMHPFLTGPDGLVYWTSQQDRGFASRVRDRSDRGVLRLRPHQATVLESAELPIEAGFGGGLVVACRPVTSHTLMKIEVRVREWGAWTFSHFRPGSSAARRLLGIRGRDGLLSDYLVSGVRVERSGAEWKHDALLGVMNVEFEGDAEGRPVLELFGPEGYLERRELPALPPIAARFYWASELFPKALTARGPCSIRLMDAGSVTVLSAVFFDFSRRQLAIDHGSDRFSTFHSHAC